MPELKPCPFCGSTDVGVVVSEEPKWSKYSPWMSVFCHSCDSVGSSAKEEDAAISAWNRRAGEPDAQEPVLALRNCLAMAVRMAVKRTTDEKAWRDVIRFCGEAGVKPEILRAAPTTEEP